MNERKLTKSELTKREDIIMNMKGNKRDLVKKYGADAEKVMYGRATNMAKKQSESMDQTNMKLKEMVKDALKNPKKADLNKDGKLSDYEETRGKSIEKNLEENSVDIENYLEDEDIDNPDEDLVIIGSGYLDIKSNFKGRPNMTNGELAALGQKVVDQLHNGNQEAAFNYITSKINEDLDLGHEDNEPHMLKADLYRIGKYAMELYNIVDGFEGEGEVDFPAWWQAKITNAKTAIVGAKHYIDFEINEPKIDAVVDTIDDIAPDDDSVDTDILDVDIDEAQSITDGDTGFTRSLYTPNEMGDASVGGEYASGAFEESLKTTVAEKLAKKLKESVPEGIKIQIKDIEDSLESGESDGESLTNETEMLLQKELKRLKSLKEGLPKGFWDKKIDAEDEDQDGKIDEDLKGLMAQGEKIAAFADKQSGYEGGLATPVRNVLAAAAVAGAPDFDGDEDLKAYYTRKLTKAIETQKGKKYMSGFSIDESYATVVNKIKKSGKSEKAAKAIAGAVASYKAKGGGKGPTAKQK